jgi:hypothetical protein
VQKEEEEPGVTVGASVAGPAIPKSEGGYSPGGHGVSGVVAV